LFKPETMTLEHVVSRGFHFDRIQSLSLRLGEGIAGRTAFERKPILIENLADSQFNYRGMLLAEQFIMYANAPLVSKGQLKGVLEVFHRSHLKAGREWLIFLEMMGNEAAIAIDNADLFNELQHSNLDLIMAYDATIEGWAQALELRDAETEGHSRRVTEMTLRLARRMNIQGLELVHIRRGSLLHDIGKMGVPDYILRKPGPLTDSEWEIMRQHPVLAYNLLSRIPYLRPALDIPYSHHERWDGSGYPRKLYGEQIPLAARIFAVVDIYDALTNDRPYRKATSQQEAFDFLRQQSGKLLDADIVETFLKMMTAQ
jgi:HD-GYP domain-containing protein (c-di-GMP phosphodiesterase class II)